jgi:hypothetical protein
MLRTKSHSLHCGLFLSAGGALQIASDPRYQYLSDTTPGKLVFEASENA